MDARRIRSQAKLHAAVLRLAAAGPVAGLGVTELAQAAGVHRSTVYEHAASPTELLQQALLAELDALREGLLADTGADPVDAVTDVTRGVLEHVARHADVYRRGLAAGDAGLHSMLSTHFRKTGLRLRELARVRVDVPVPGVDDDVVADAAARFLADGTVGVIESWLQRPELTVDDVLRLYVRLIPDWWPRDLAVQSD